MNIVTERRKSMPDEYRDPRVKVLEEWRRLSEEAKTKVLGDNLWSESERLYTMNSVGGGAPSFRPQVFIPELQKIILEDSNKITDITPEVYIYGDGQQVESREKALRAMYQRASTNYHLLYATLLSRYLGTGFLQLGYSPDLRNGRGGLWVKSRHPATVGMDPTTDYEFTPTFVYYDDYMYLEEIRKAYPQTSQNLKNVPKPGGNLSQNNAPGYGFQMPAGSPMAGMPNMPGHDATGITGTRDNRLRVSRYFFKDYTREVVEKKDLPAGALVHPEFKWLYPNGRMIVECNGVILADGPNPFPHRLDLDEPFFGIVPVWAIPPLFNGPWGVPVTRFSETLQSMSEKMYTQVYENFVRTNNAVWFVDENSGIDVEAFGGVPGEVQVLRPGSRVPSIVQPPQMSQAMAQFPDQMLTVQQRLHGNTQSAQGSPGAGNISAQLFDASVLQSSGLLQLAGRLQYFTVSQLATAMFYTACRYIDRFQLPFRGDGRTSMAIWEGIQDPHSFDLIFDEDSIQPLSGMAMKALAPQLMQSGILNTERGLQILGIPHAEQIAKEQQQTAALAALAAPKNAGRR